MSDAVCLAWEEDSDASIRRATRHVVIVSDDFIAVHSESDDCLGVGLTQARSYHEYIKPPATARLSVQRSSVVSSSGYHQYGA